jgi:hypothetical protein
MVIARFLIARLLGGRTIQAAARTAPAPMPYQRGQFWIRRFHAQARTLCAALAALTHPAPAPDFVHRALAMLQTVGPGNSKGTREEDDAADGQGRQVGGNTRGLQAGLMGTFLRITTLDRANAMFLERALTGVRGVASPDRFQKTVKVLPDPIQRRKPAAPKKCGGTRATSLDNEQASAPRSLLGRHRTGSSLASFG